MSLDFEKKKTSFPYSFCMKTKETPLFLFNNKVSIMVLPSCVMKVVILEKCSKV